LGWTFERDPTTSFLQGLPRDPSVFGMTQTPQLRYVSIMPDPVSSVHIPSRVYSSTYLQSIIPFCYYLPTTDWLIDCFIQAIHRDRMSRPYIDTLLNKRDSLLCLISRGTSVKRVYVLLSTNLSFLRLVFHIAEAYVRRAI
jgi:hypothetical protein